MRVLLSAYACEPGRGSEPEVGWTWAVGLARRGHEVWVITRANNQAPIEREADASLPNLHFVYFDLPARWLALKRWLGVNVYYHAWQAGALKVARQLHAQVRFDRAHHVTFVVARHPSFLRHLGVPYTFGPVAGGECIPWRMLGGLPSRALLVEVLRPLINRLFMSLPSVRSTVLRASQVVVTSPQTLALLPTAARQRAKVRIAITMPSCVSAKARTRQPGQPLRVAFIGRLQALKGIHLAIAAIRAARESGAQVSLTIVGDGPQEAWLRRLAKSGGATSYVKFIPWLPREQLVEIYRDHDVLLFPSLRDSGGMVVLEAMQTGMPVICFALGGPGVIVGDDCGFSVPAIESRRAIQELSCSLVRLASDEAAYAARSLRSLQRIRDFKPSHLFADLGY